VDETTTARRRGGRTSTAAGRTRLHRRVQAPGARAALCTSATPEERDARCTDLRIAARRASPIRSCRPRAAHPAARARGRRTAVVPAPGRTGPGSCEPRDVQVASRPRVRVESDAEQPASATPATSAGSRTRPRCVQLRRGTVQELPTGDPTRPGPRESPAAGGPDRRGGHRRRGGPAARRRPAGPRGARRRAAAPRGTRAAPTGACAAAPSCRARGPSPRRPRASRSRP